MAKKERVCVIGAGLSGLVAMKELLEEGHDVTCYEKELCEGGVFNFPTGVAYDAMRLTVSQHFMCFTSKPAPPHERRELWTRSRYARYLHSFAEHFDLFGCIQFGTRVEAIELCQGGQVRLTCRRGTESFDRNFDAVAICQGAFRADDPRMPDIDGLDNFAGRVVHSGTYEDPESFEGLRVLCVGMGETAADITLQISEVAASCTLSMRSFPEIIKRYRGPDRRTTDVDSTRLFHWMSLEQRKEFYAFKRKFRDTRTLSDHDRLVYEWNQKSGGRRSLQKNDDFVANIIDGRIQVRAPSQLRRVEGHTVTFDDDTTLDVDAIVFCTGYEESSIPNGWIKDVEISDVRQLYKHAFHVDMGRRIVFFGWARPRQGGLPAISELLARYFALLCSGERELPPRSEMERVIAEDCAREEEWFANSKSTRTLVHYTRYLDDLAELIGCQPQLEDYLDDPELLTHLICSSNIGLSYRLRGPGAYPEIAREACVSAPIADPYEAIDIFLDAALREKLNVELATRVADSIRTYLTTHTTDMPSTETWGS
jgi:dimethylaniline monooxygenase (N-oxide forming)